MAYHRHYGNDFRLDHGHCRDGKHSGTYQAWIDMRRRCNNPRHPAYEHYGARGIAVCQPWDDFSNFLSDMGVRPDGLTLERIDNNSGYSPENCCWATKIEQVNNRRVSRRLTLNGVTKSLAQWAATFNILQSTLAERLKRGWSELDAVTKPTRKINFRR